MRIYLLPAVLLIAASAASAAETTPPAPRTFFEPGKPWFDIEGNTIQAHSGGFLRKGDIVYWYGEEKTYGNLNKVGVACYSSRDLYNWKKEGIVLPKQAMPPEFQDQGICERPKVIYCAKTGQYVMWMHLDNQRYTTASAGVAVCDSPTGTFRFLGHSRPISYDFGASEQDRCKQKQLGGTYRDMNLFADDDGRAYAFYASEDNKTMYVVRLNEQYTGPETPLVLGKTWARILIGNEREAPAPFKYNGTYYLITSACTGWGFNGAGYATATNILGPWQNKGNPCVGEGRNKTFNSQSTFVFPVPGKRPGSFIFMADRWNPGKLGASPYVWLPLRIRDDGTFKLEFLPRWDLSIFDQPLAP